MANIVLDDYLTMLQKSRLFEDKAEIEGYLASWRADEGTTDPDSVPSFSDWLVANDHVTRWQADNILAGKYKGFFLGQYKLLRSIGAGGMSSVYLAVHTLLERQVAIKVLPKSRVTTDSSYLERFLLEAQAVAALDHPNIVRAYDIDNEGGSIYYLVMEFVDGPDLLSLVKKNGPLDIYKAAQYIRQAAIGLEYAHNNRLIHRDVKPANLLVDKDEIIHVLDLGLARFTDERRASLTIAYDENVLGTADYLAPEQARNSHNVDGRADIYGLGCTLYYLLVGHVPFPDGTLPQRIAAHQKRMPKAIQEERPEVPEDLCAICWKMMAKDPNDRQQTMQEVADDLTDWLLENGQKIAGYTGVLPTRKKAAQTTDSGVVLEGDALKELEAIAQIAVSDSRHDESSVTKGLFHFSKAGGSSVSKSAETVVSGGSDSSRKKEPVKKESPKGGLFGFVRKPEKGSKAEKNSKPEKGSKSGTVVTGKTTSSSVVKKSGEQQKQDESSFMNFLNEKERFRPGKGETGSGTVKADDSHMAFNVVNLNLDLNSGSTPSSPSSPSKSSKVSLSAPSQKTGGSSKSGRKSAPAKSDSKTDSNGGAGYKKKQTSKQETWMVIGICAAVLVVLIIIACLL
ncbi:MAG: serine/threonine-protein kinase [Planctomycetia bacterium]|nr:serine/threonine-protein kinase [Planctomycetia bacterium]